MSTPRGEAGELAVQQNRETQEDSRETMSSDSTRRWKRGLVEFVVIFAGVSLSLLADGWRDERREGRERTAVLERIEEDLREDLDEHAFVRGRADALLGTATWLLDRWGAAAPEPDSTASVLARLGCPLIFEYRSPAYAGLKSSSGLPLISSTDLGHRIIEYFEVHQVEAENFAENLAAAQARLLEALYGYVAFDACYPEKLPTRAPLLVSWDVLSTDLALRNRLVEVVTLSSLTAEWVDRAVTIAGPLVEELDSEGR